MGRSVLSLLIGGLLMSPRGRRSMMRGRARRVAGIHRSGIIRRRTPRSYMRRMITRGMK